MEKFNTPNNDPYESVEHNDISDAELRSIMGETAAKLFIDEVESAEAAGTLDEIPEQENSYEAPTIEDLIRDYDESKIDAEITDSAIHGWIDGSEK
ncbi:MAG: hypothetical protein L0H36_01840 [bacterium]|nr:hypothetical protein [bacterium]